MQKQKKSICLETRYLNGLVLTDKKCRVYDFRIGNTRFKKVLVTGKKNVYVGELSCSQNRAVLHISNFIFIRYFVNRSRDDFKRDRSHCKDLIQAVDALRKFAIEHPTQFINASVADDPFVWVGNRFHIGLSSSAIWKQGSRNQDVCIEKYSHGYSPSFLIPEIMAMTSSSELSPDSAAAPDMLL